MRLLLVLMLLGFVPSVSLAQSFVGGGSWCLVLDEIEQCTFNTADDCYASAYENGGYCQQNARRSRVAGDAPWCVVSEAGRDCTYFSQRTCINQALSMQGGCVTNTEKILQASQMRNKLAGFGEMETAGAEEQNLMESLKEAQSLQPGAEQGMQ